MSSETGVRASSARPIGTKMMPVRRRRVSTGAHVGKTAARSGKISPVISNGRAELLIDLYFGAKPGPGLLSLTHLVACREPSH
jgi:hypothetical protein